jgi:hypothetical protein
MSPRVKVSGRTCISLGIILRIITDLLALKKHLILLGFGVSASYSTSNGGCSREGGGRGVVLSDRRVKLTTHTSILCRG